MRGWAASRLKTIRMRRRTGEIQYAKRGKAPVNVFQALFFSSAR
jgi:hypothetical protein